MWIISFWKASGSHFPSCYRAQNIFIASRFTRLVSFKWVRRNRRMNASESRLKLNLWIVPVTITAATHNNNNRFFSSRTTRCRCHNETKQKENCRTKYINWLTWVLFGRQIFPLELSAFVCRTSNEMEISCRMLPSTLGCLFGVRVCCIIASTAGNRKRQKEAEETKIQDKYNARTAAARTHIYRCRDMQMSLLKYWPSILSAPTAVVRLLLILLFLWPWYLILRNNFYVLLHVPLRTSHKKRFIQRSA